MSRSILVGWILLGFAGLRGAGPTAAQMAGDGLRSVAAQPQGSESPHNLSLEAGPFGASLYWAHALPGNGFLGAGAGAGLRLGIMVFGTEFSRGSYGVDRLFTELAHGDVFYRSAATDRPQIEAGLRVAWLYNPPTEYETLFFGAQVTVLARLGRLRIGPRVIIGQQWEEAGRTAFDVGLIPVVARLVWGL